MTFESFAHVPVTEELLRHVWEGESDGRQGGHRYGLGREGKTEFPENWDLVMVRTAISLTLTSPQSVKIRGRYIHLLRQVAEVIVAVTLITNKTNIDVFTAFPVCGVNVFRNDRGLKTFLPLELSVLES